jgi:type IV pilus assembly protein PilB
MSQDARRDEELNTQRRARILNLQYIDTTSSAKRLYSDLLSVQEMYRIKAVPLYEDDHNVSFGVTNTTSQHIMTELRHRFPDQRVTFGLISDSGYRDYMRLYDPPKEVVYENISLNQTGDQELQDRVSATLNQVRADDMLAYLVQQAHRLNASDIHLETQRENVRIRLRIDGVLHPIAQLNHEKYRILLSAIASAGNISTASDDAQQGHIAQRVKMANGSEVDVNLRLETVPTITGMDVVMRLFNMDQTMYSLDRLGLIEDERKIVDDIIDKPSGLVLAVGPTGSGKTTTLYSMLNSLNSENRKLITIEDPVEYEFNGITQISVTSKTSQETNFANKLRAVLRLDPDIVMVGEIRDIDTAKTALQASLTGHLVLSTFHASSASAALTRLMDVIDQNPLFASAIRLIMAQRLVRRLDDNTKQAYRPDQATLARIEQVLKTLPPHIQIPNLATIQLYSPGSSEENPYGYSGQIALREQLLMTDELKYMIESRQLLSSHQIEKTAIQGGMRTMLQDGILKAIAGYTSLEEVYRVVE